MKPFWIVVAVVVAVAAIVFRKRLSTERRIIAAIVVVAAAVYGSGLVKLPNLEKVIEDVGTALGPWTYALVGVFAFLETGAFVGLVIPGETALLVGGVVAGQGRISIVVVIAIAWAAAVAGDATSFFLGRRLGRDFMLRHGPRVGITRQRLEHVEGFFDRHGGPTILLGRFVGIVRAIAPFVLGSSKLAFRRFLPYDVVGAGLWAAALLLLGYVFWHSLSKAVDIAKQGALALGAVIAVVVAVVAAWRYWRKPEHRERTRAWLHEQAERPGVAPVVRAARPVWRRLSGPMKALGNRLTPGDLGLEVTSLVAVLAVGAFTFAGLAAAVDNGTALGFDSRAFTIGFDVRTGWLTSVVKVVTALGSLPAVSVVVGAGVGFLAMRRDVTGAAAVAAGAVLTYAAVHIVKAAVNQPRPPAALVQAAGSAFPSAHAAYSIAYVAVAVAIARALPNWAGRTALVSSAVVFAAIIGLTRVYLRVHYLSDVLAGWGLAAAIFALCGLIAVIVAFMRQNEAARA